MFMETFVEISARLHIIGLRRMVLQMVQVKEGTSEILLQSGLDDQWSADSPECYFYVRNVRDSLSDGETPHELRCGD